MPLHTSRKIIHLFSDLLLIIDTSSTLKKTRVQVEHITWISFTSRRASQNQRNLTICNSLFTKIIIYYKSTISAITEILTNSSTSKRCIILHSSRISSSSSNDNCIWHCTMFLKSSYQRSYS